MSEGDEAFAQTAADLAAAEKDRHTEAQRRDEEQQRLAEERRRAQEEEARRARMIELSKTPSKTIGTFNGVDSGVGRPVKVVLTDVGFSFSSESHKFADNFGRQPENAGFTQTAFGWNGFSVTCNRCSQGVFGWTVVFKDREERDRFYEALTKAFAEWRDKFREIQ